MCGRSADDLLAAKDDRARTIGRRNDVISLNSVLLPAPFGPITERISPSSTLEIDVVDRDQAAEALGQLLDLEQAHSAASFSAPDPSRHLDLLVRRGAPEERLRMPFGSKSMTAIISRP